MELFKKVFAGVSVALLPAVIAMPAFAQRAATAPTSADGELTEIVVTAERREENLQKESISISVLTSEDIGKAGITQAQNLAFAVPGLQIGQAGAATQIYIRGVGDFGSTAGTNPAVAFNVDGVYVARPAGIEGNFYDLERVEVLKGPQGTLYGRNATGGAINVITQKPKLGEFETLGAVEVGNYAEKLAEAAINLPVGDTFAVRAAAQIVHRNPYLTENFDDEIRQSGRVQALWHPSDVLSLRISGDYTHEGGGGPGYVLIPAPAGTSPWTSDTDPRFTNYINNLSVASNRCGIRIPPIGGNPPSPFYAFPYSGACPNFGPFTQAQLTFGTYGEQGHQDNRLGNVSAQLDYDLGFATLTMLPAFRDTRLDYVTNPGGDTNFNIAENGHPETSEAKSFETRLANGTGFAQWVLGGYFFKEDQLGFGHVTSGYLQNVLLKQVIGSKTFAGFGQSLFNVTDRFRVIVGGRYTSDHRTAAPQSSNLPPSIGYEAAAGASGGACVQELYPNFVGPGVFGCPGPVLLGSKTFTKFNWKGGLEFDLAPQNMVYFTASTGFKAGGFYAGETASGTAASYEPETLTAYELGSRNRFLDNKLQINVAGFFYDYKNHQEPVITQDATGAVVQAIQNVGSGHVHGLDLDAIYQLTRNDNLHVGAEYLQSRYTEFALSSPLIVGTPTFFPVGSTGCPIVNTFNAAGAGLTVPPTGVGVGTAPTGAVLPGYTRGTLVGTQTTSCVGFPFTRSPTWSGLASYSHTFDLPNSGNIEPEADMQFSSRRYLATDYLATSDAAAYQTYNASLTYHSPARNWSLAGFVRNISDRAIYTASARSFSIVGLNGASIAPPRTYGARLDFKF